MGGEWRGGVLILGSQGFSELTEGGGERDV